MEEADKRMSFFGEVHKLSVETIDVCDTSDSFTRAALYVSALAHWTLIIPMLRIMSSDDLPDDHALRDFGYTSWKEVYRDHYGEEQ
jgi:hypothetical protein